MLNYDLGQCQVCTFIAQCKIAILIESKEGVYLQPEIYAVCDCFSMQY